MNVYCVMSGEARTDLDHVVYASTSKIEVLDVAESDVRELNNDKNI